LEGISRIEGGMKLLLLEISAEGRLGLLTQQVDKIRRNGVIHWIQQ